MSKEPKVLPEIYIRRVAIELSSGTILKFSADDELAEVIFSNNSLIGYPIKLERLIELFKEQPK